MIELWDGPCVAIDVDDTLVLWRHPDSDHEINGVPYKLNQRVIEHMEQYKARKQIVVLWSAGGRQWAKTIAEKHNLTHLIDYVSGKFRWTIDDNPSSIHGDTYFIC